MLQQLNNARDISRPPFKAVLLTISLFVTKRTRHRSSGFHKAFYSKRQIILQSRHPSVDPYIHRHIVHKLYIT